MRFLIAPNAYKGIFTALEAVALIEEILVQAYASSQFTSQALADGGDGTCALLADSLGLERIDCLSLNAIGQPIPGFYAWEESSKTAFLDVSTGEFLTAQGNEEYIDKLLQNFSPSEILIQKNTKAQFKTAFGEDYNVFYLED